MTITYLEPNAKLVGHNSHITKMAVNWFHPELLVTASHDKTLLVWNLIFDDRNRFKFAHQKKSLIGHGHCVSDVVLSEDAKYALSASYDKTLRLWDLETGECTRKFISHTGDVTCVAFSNDYRLIVSGSRDRTIKIWNTLGECKATLGSNKGDGHTDWVSSVHYATYDGGQAVVSCGWDSSIKVWGLEFCNLLTTRKTSTGPIVAGALTPDSTLSVAGGKNGTINLIETEDLGDPKSEPLAFVDQESVVALSFSPNRYWLAAAYPNSIKLYDLDSKKVLQELRVPAEEQGKHPRNTKCTALVWSADGENLFTAHDDNTIRVWTIASD